VSRLVLIRGEATFDRQPGDVAISVADLRSRPVRLQPVRSFMRHAEAAIVTSELCHAGRPFALAALARWCSRGPVYLVDETGARRDVRARDLMRWSMQVAAEPVQRRWFIRDVRRRVEREWQALGDRQCVPADLTLPCAYLRTDLSFHVRAGGSVGHISGVINNLQAFGLRPVFITTDRVPTVDPAIPTHLVCGSERFWNYRELPAFVMDCVFGERADDVLRQQRFGFIYQRASLNNFAGVRLARRHKLPLVLEYNGSEVWISRHWGAHPLQYAELSTRIDALNFAAADLVIVVSDPIKEELRSRGVDPRKVLVNPNGVDPERYTPQIDGTAIRRRHGFGAQVVFGFIGTFGAWHGAEVLADAYVRMLQRRPDLRATTRLFLIGDGLRLARTKAIIASSAEASANTVFAGLVPQSDGPACLAACDVLVSPHVPNPDATPFFGSPTKLFEYMAMGRAIVASDLDQIGQVLRHDASAWLVPPDDAEALAAGLAHVADDAALRQRLGTEARRDAVAKHSWREHTRRILDALPSAAIARPQQPESRQEER
jgi:glycosyltransferase involved in cell wall biosynthesis